MSIVLEFGVDTMYNDEDRRKQNRLSSSVVKLVGMKQNPFNWEGCASMGSTFRMVMPTYEGVTLVSIAREFILVYERER